MDLDNDNQSIGCVATTTTGSDFSDLFVTATTAATTLSNDSTFFDLSFASLRPPLSVLPNLEAVTNIVFSVSALSSSHDGCMRAEHDNDLKLCLQCDKFPG